MTPHIARIALAGLLVAAGTSSGPAYAHTCTATASTPAMNADYSATGHGSFQCLVPDPGTMTVYVCLEVATLPSLWNTGECTETSRTGPGFVFGSATAAVCQVSGALLMRTTAYGVSGAGFNHYAESTPAVVNCGIVN